MPSCSATYGGSAVSEWVENGGQGIKTKSVVSAAGSDAVANRVAGAELQGSVAISKSLASGSGKGSAALSEDIVEAIGGGVAAGATAAVAGGIGSSATGKQMLRVGAGSVGASATFAKAAGSLSKARAPALFSTALGSKLPLGTRAAERRTHTHTNTHTHTHTNLPWCSQVDSSSLLITANQSIGATSANLAATDVGASAEVDTAAAAFDDSVVISANRAIGAAVHWGAAESLGVGGTGHRGIQLPAFTPPPPPSAHSAVQLPACRQRRP